MSSKPLQEGTGKRVSTSDDIEVSTYLEIAQEKHRKKAASPVTPNRRPDRMASETILIMDFGSQYSRLIARRIRELKVYCELISPNTDWEDIADLNPKGIILSGGPSSVYESSAPIAPAETE